MFRTLFRQRRRLMLCWLLFTGAVFVGVTGRPEFEEALANGSEFLAIWLLVVSFLMAFAGTVIVAVFITIVPQMRRETELLAMLALALVSLNTFAPGLRALPGVGPFVPLLVAFALILGVYGPLMHLLPWRIQMRARATFHLPLPAEDVWRLLVPGEAPAAQFWEPLVQKVTHGADAEGRVAYTSLNAKGAHESCEVIITRTEPFRLADFEDPEGLELRAFTRITIAPVVIGPEGCDVTWEEDYPQAAPPIALAYWLDDTLGDVGDHLAANARGRRDWSVAGRFRKSVLRKAARRAKRAPAPAAA